MPKPKFVEFTDRVALSAIAQFESIKRSKRQVTAIVRDTDGRRWSTELWYTPERRISGLLIKPAYEHLPADHPVKVELSLPFRETWTVGNGGLSAETNGHHGNKAQHYAYDFFIKKDGKTHRNAGKDLTAYYAYDLDVIAPAPGAVSQVVEGIHEHGVETTDGYFVPGNTVIIDHGNDEFSLLGHFKTGTIAVKEGDSVRRGQFLGKCGNSGNSSEPHIHFHLQKGAFFSDAVALPAYFADIVVDSKRSTRVIPIRDQQIANP